MRRYTRRKELARYISLLLTMLFVSCDSDSDNDINRVNDLANLQPLVFMAGLNGCHEELSRLWV
jgi:hypothetical protein